MVETLVYYRKNGTLVPDRAVVNRLTDIPAELQAKLANAGLINVTKSRTCQELWDACFKHKTDVKPKTLAGYRLYRKIFFETFSPNEPIDKLTAEKLLDWKTALLTQYATASVAGILKVVKMVFAWAVEQDWLMKNPMQNVPRGSFINRENDRIVTMEEYAKLLDACPNQEWRTIIALVRIGGLRCPSELQRLRWTDVHWAENRFLVHSPKTEQHEGHRERLVPLFPELRAELEKHYSLDETKENEFVIEHYQKTSWNLYTPFQTIARRAGLAVIIRPFDNMRMSRSNEVVRDFGEAKENLWIGHSTQVMRDHYFRLSDDDFLDAAGKLDDQNSHAESHAKPTGMDGKME